MKTLQHPSIRFAYASLRKDYLQGKEVLLSSCKSYLFTFIAFFWLATSFAQNIGINADGSTPNSSAGLDIKFSDKGLLIPRVSINNVNIASPVVSPAEGLLVYNESGTETKGFYYWNGTKWVLLITSISPTNSWLINGNIGTVDGTHFIGTTDSVPLNFKAYNQRAGRIGLTGDASTFFGYQAGKSDDKSDNENVGIGYHALYTNTSGTYNIAIGPDALHKNTTGNLNIASGWQALYNNTTGAANIANGFVSLFSNTTGYGNIATGRFSLYSNTTGFENVSTGIEALFSNTIGQENIATGTKTLHSNTSGDNNIASGYQALYKNTTGSNNIANGNGALYSNLSGSNNIAMGYQTLYHDSTGGNNIAIGYYTLYNNTKGLENIATGTNALYSNTSGSNNIGGGYQALFNNTTGINNIAHGYRTLYHNLAGSNNIAIGYQNLFLDSIGSNNIATGTFAVYNNKTGNYDIGIGMQALYNLTSGDNNIALGYNAQVPSNTGSNQIRIGNTSITYAGIQVAWTVTSDQRLKKDIQDSPLGLKFINSLRPVSYIRINDVQQKSEYGFIAQEVKSALIHAGVNPQGIISTDDNGIYSLRYNDFIAISVKAIQELNNENNNLKKQLYDLGNRVEVLEKLLKK